VGNGHDALEEEGGGGRGGWMNANMRTLMDKEERVGEGGREDARTLLSTFLCLKGEKCTHEQPKRDSHPLPPGGECGEGLGRRRGVHRHRKSVSPLPRVHIVNRELAVSLPPSTGRPLLS